ncbi:helix-turn-helix transcriptional regulator [Saccharothrix coeruleofusca]|uniref:XRE family transcriptional regulator n=1 Tax=Saccharothrix coeruleofusca TaxID=33919 RepID=A0A918AGM5_9PSEU|nr:helix-turn-helix transcriptional regulator [Saccharothrix coeruleofusca]MBP2340657.1 transcriptional regulator with XRE-family HTH domain [Saccharothrix coeruleofusca]GGP34064.1 XRE family transcriptional regulator [Saccharothrix coeruleofusca]
MERDDLADFLRRRRALLQPEDVGVPAGGRRRTPGLRRFEVAQLAGMSPDYYARLEQGRGPRPSVAVLTALARALRLTTDERDHLLRLAGHLAPPRAGGDEHVDRGLRRLLDGLPGLPALVASDLNIVLAQNRMADALLGEWTRFRGLARSCTYRWFTDPEMRGQHPVEDHEHESRARVDDLRATLAARPADPAVREMVGALRARSAEFARLWARHDVAVRRGDRKRILHPAVGLVELDFDVLGTGRQDQRLVVYSPAPGSAAVTQLELLAVLGGERSTPSGSAERHLPS